MAEIGYKLHTLLCLTDFVHPRGLVPDIYKGLEECISRRSRNQLMSQLGIWKYPFMDQTLWPELIAFWIFIITIV